MRKLTAGLCLVSLLATAGTVCAGERAGAGSISLFGGGYTFDGEEHLKTAPTYGLRLGYDLTDHFGVEAVGSFLATEGTNDELSVNAINYHLDLLWNFMPEGPLVPYFVVGGGGITAGHGKNFDAVATDANGRHRVVGGQNTRGTANAGLGFKLFLTDSVALRADGRQLFIIDKHSETRFNWEYTAGLSFLFGGKEKQAAAAAQPSAVPTSKLAANPPSVVKGQPVNLSWSSQDATNCDIQPGIGQVQPQGSTSVSPAGNVTYTLTCNGPGGTTNSMAQVAVAEPTPLVSMKATPDKLMLGEATVLEWKAENATNCKMEPGEAVDTQGSMKVSPTVDTTYALTCNSAAGGSTTSTVTIPVAQPSCPVVLTAEQEETVNLLINFDSDKAELKPEYYPNVDALGDFMKKYPSCKVRIEGHTDNSGTTAHNQALSQERADAVKGYLLEKYHLDPNMIEAVGYGETKPVDTNDTPEGMAKNRRVQVYHPAAK